MDDNIVIELTFDEFCIVRTALLSSAFDLQLNGRNDEAAEYEKLRDKLIGVWESDIKKKFSRYKF